MSKRPHRPGARALLTALGFAATLLVTGCGYTLSPAARRRDAAPAPGAATPRTRTETPAPNPTSADAANASVDQVQEEAERRAQQLAEAIQASSAEEQVAPPRVLWLNPAVPRAAAAAAPPDTPTAEAPAPQPRPAISTPAEPLAPPPTVTTRRPTATAPRQPADTAETDYAELIRRVREHVLNSDEPEMRRALAAAGVSLLDPDADFDPDTLRFLNRDQREQVRRYHRFITDLGRHLADGGAALDPELVLADLDRALGQRAIRIGALKLCTRVSGFGVYDELTDATLLAGREHPIIVYTELDSFQPVERPAGGYRVSLQEDVELYNDADGLLVWHQPRVAVTDDSRNRRRDFFVVQLVHLPPRLTVGRYQLKVRITDQSNGSTDEATVPLRIVADRALAAEHPR